MPPGFSFGQPREEASTSLFEGGSRPRACAVGNLGTGKLRRGVRNQQRMEGK